MDYRNKWNVGISGNVDDVYEAIRDATDANIAGASNFDVAANNVTDLQASLHQGIVIIP